VDLFGFGLPLAVPGATDSSAGAPSEEAPRDTRPRNATQLYREVDRLMTTLVRGVEVRRQLRG